MSIPLYKICPNFLYDLNIHILTWYLSSIDPKIPAGRADYSRWRLPCTYHQHFQSGWLYIEDNDALTALGMIGLWMVSGYFTIKDTSSLCRSLAEELRDHVRAGGGIGGKISIDGKSCWVCRGNLCWLPGPDPWAGIAGYIPARPWGGSITE